MTSSPCDPRNIFHYSSVGYILLDQNLTILDANSKALECLGRVVSLALFEAKGLSLKELLPKHSPEVLELLLSAQKDGRVLHKQKAKVTGIDKRTYYFDITVIPASPSCLFLECRDVSEEVFLLEKLKRERDFSRMLLEKTHALVVALDRQGAIVEFNEACQRLTGYSREEALGRKVWEFLLVPEEIEPVKNVFNDLTAGNFPNQFENFWVTKGGEKRLIAWTNTVEVDEKGDVVVVIGTGIDVTEERLKEKRLLKMATTDPLTGLGNRTMLTLALQKALQRAQKEEGYRFGVMFVDLDDFKVINDTYGHIVGDKVLKDVGQRLSKGVRAHDLVARVGGDEFVILADSARDPQGLKSLAARVLRCFDEPFVADAFPPLRLTASIGGVFADKGFKGSAEKLIELADQAMFESKKAGKGRSAFIFAGDIESP